MPNASDCSSPVPTDRSRGSSLRSRAPTIRFPPAISLPGRRTPGRIAFVSATPGPEQDANGDPMIITRYVQADGFGRPDPLQRQSAPAYLRRRPGVRRCPAAHHGRLLRALARLVTGGRSHHVRLQSRARSGSLLQLRHLHGAGCRRRDRSADADKERYYHPAWSPDGKRIAYSGTTRSLTSSETTMEDTHVWVTNADGTDRHGIGDSLDNRQGPPRWSGDSRTIYFSAFRKGSNPSLQSAAAGGRAELALGDTGSIGSSVTHRSGRLDDGLCALNAGRPPELYVAKSVSAPVAVTTLNQTLLKGRKIGGVESFTFASFDGTPIEAFLTKPVDVTAGSRHPLIVMMHEAARQQGPESGTPRRKSMRNAAGSR